MVGARMARPTPAGRFEQHGYRAGERGAQPSFETRTVERGGGEVQEEVDDLGVLPAHRDCARPKPGRSRHTRRDRRDHAVPQQGAVGSFSRIAPLLSGQSRLWQRLPLLRRSGGGGEQVQHAQRLPGLVPRRDLLPGAEIAVLIDAHPPPALRPADDRAVVVERTEDLALARAVDHCPTERLQCVAGSCCRVFTDRHGQALAAGLHPGSRIGDRGRRARRAGPGTQEACGEDREGEGRAQGGEQGQRARTGHQWWEAFKAENTMT